MERIFLMTFLVGFGLTVISLVLGAADASGVGHAGDGGGHADLGDAGHGDAAGHPATVSPVNFQTLVAFVMGVGGFGYLLEHLAAGPLVVVAGAGAGGLAVGRLILTWLRFLTRHSRPMPLIDYVGVAGRLTVGIREGGTGELVYTLHGTRMVTAARSADGMPISKGESVIVIRYENGIAYVEPWQDAAAPPSASGLDHTEREGLR